MLPTSWPRIRIYTEILLIHDFDYLNTLGALPD